jgi:hypothetical protein
MTDITYGNATVVGTETGWALPGGQHTCNRVVAEAAAMKMHLLMGEVE